MTRTSSGERGFTLVELAAAVGIIAILIGLLLPAVQKVREEATRSSSLSRLAEIEGAARAFFETTGRLPSSIEELGDGSVRSAFGERDGARVLVHAADPNRLVVVAEPLAGVTGSETAVLEVRGVQDGTLVSSTRFIETPGAKEGRKAIDAALLRAGSQALAATLRTVPAEDRDQAFDVLRPSLEDPASRADVVASLTLAGGSVSPASLYAGLSGFCDGSVLPDPGQLVGMCDGSVRPAADQAVIRGLWSTIETTLRLGAYGETWPSLPSSPVDPGSALRPALVSFKSLTRLTEESVRSAELRSRLLLRVRAAEQADALGDTGGKEKELRAFASMLRRALDAAIVSRGTSAGAPRTAPLSFAEAEALLTLAGTL
jgi:prepilin-type N-terminal cleavage/methylation domain-containing protein